MKTLSQAMNEWYEHCEPATIQNLQNQLGSFAALKAHRQPLAVSAISRFRNRSFADHPGKDREYVENQRQFRLWLRNITYTEALKLLPGCEPVENVIRHVLPRQTKSLLHWIYIDQLDAYELATTLDLLSNRRKQDLAAAKQRAKEGYEELCHELRQRLDAEVSQMLFTTILPYPPILIRG